MGGPGRVKAVDRLCEVESRMAELCELCIVQPALFANEHFRDKLTFNGFVMSPRVNPSLSGHATGSFGEGGLGEHETLECCEHDRVRVFDDRVRRSPHAGS